MNIDINRHIIPESASLLEAMQSINALCGTAMTLFVCDAERRVSGSVTDGDIRRSLIAGAGLESPVETAMHRDFLCISPDDDPLDAFDNARRLGIRLMPMLDSERRLQSIIDLKTTKCMLPLDAVMMAGGRGERLRPLTLKTPKPLLKIGGKAIIDYNVDELEANGIERIFITVNYLKEPLQEHFSVPRRAATVCVEEPRRLGTMGSLALVDGLRHDDILVMNSDILTDLDFEAMFRHHKASEADLTMATIAHNIAVPFAILKTEGDRVVGLQEKPSFNYSANAGVYILKRSLLSRITPGEYLDAPDFIESIISDRLKVCHFPINGTWIDIGSPADFRHADELMNRPRR